jgi:hypothetical protein
MQRFLTMLGIGAVITIIASSSAAAQGLYATGSTGVDVSWPNCNAVMPAASFGIVGVSNGTGYTTNPCLAQETAAYTANLSLYVNTGWYNKSAFLNPTSPKVCNSGDNNCLAYNYGYNAGLYAFDAAAHAGVSSSTWWLDVETENTWNKDTIQNRNSLQGEFDALKAKGIITIGAYSTSAQWQTITGGWKNSWPNWGATTWTTAAQAQSYCTGHEFTGGPSYLMQYLPKRSLFDQNVAC